jgi:hypothetical protein
MKLSELREKVSVITRLSPNAEHPEGEKLQTAMVRCVLTFDEARDFALGGEGDWAFGDGCSGWHGESMKDFKKHVEHGMEPMDGIEQLVTEVETLLDLETLGPSWEQDIMGGSPNVPAFLTGSPLSMNRWVEHEENQKGLVRIVCDASSSCSINSSALASRAKAVTALVRTISMFRPVEFWLASCGDPGYQDTDMMEEAYGYTRSRDVDTVCMVEMSSSPVDMGMVTLAMSQAWCRRFQYGVEYNLAHDDSSGSLGWPSNDVTRCLSLNDDGRFAPAFDIIIPPLHCSEGGEFGKGAADWVLKHTVLALEGSGAAHTVYNNETISTT